MATNTTAIAITMGSFVVECLKLASFVNFITAFSCLTAEDKVHMD